jgi:hypothetical protein
LKADIWKFSACVLIEVLLNPIFGWADSLPAGIGAYRIGSRFITSVSETYDQHGNLQPLGSRLNSHFDGRSILNGDQSSDLYRLASELNQIADPSQPNQTYADRLNLGQLKGEVEASIQAQFVGISFGLPNQWNVVAGAPWIRAQVDTKIALVGNNNAAEIRDELGGLAYDQLREGLDRAAMMNTASIQKAIRDAGYQELGEWRNESVGDLRLGINKEFRKLATRGGQLSPRWELMMIVPTGYVDDPAVLNDVGLGKGYFQMTNQLSTSILSRSGLEFGFMAGYSYNFNTTRSVRLPETDESLVDIGRTITASLNPGDDGFAGSNIQYGREWWKIGLAGQYSRHFADSYSGSLIGNYEALSELSASERFEAGVTLSFSSIAAYSRRKFAVPAMLDIAYQRVAGAVNETPQNYVEIAFTSFFDTGRSKAKTNRDSKSRQAQKLASR